MSERSATGDLRTAIVAAGVRDARVLGAFEAVPRAAFVPAGLRDRARLDEPVPIQHQQVTTQPSLIARMLEALALGGDETILEIGTGLGFQTALLAQLGRFVWSVERWEDLAVAAQRNLRDSGVANARVIAGDGSRGLPEHAPYDAIVVAAAFPEVPPPLVDQLAVDGRLVQPIGPGGDEDVVLFRKLERGLERVASITGAHFVRLYGEHGYAGAP
jgi:protein-L-isoaspartate(D-aspartate) O-methyltransferase